MLVTRPAPSSWRSAVSRSEVSSVACTGSLSRVWETGHVLRTEAVVDLSAIRANVASLKAGTAAEVMAVVKADGYGHGLVPSARAALAGGATWLGTAVVDEALALRAAGITVPLLSWLWTPDEAGTVRRAVE